MYGDTGPILGDAPALALQRSSQQPFIFLSPQCFVLYSSLWDCHSSKHKRLPNQRSTFTSSTPRDSRPDIPPTLVVLMLRFLKLRRVTTRGAQPSARLSEEICLSEGSAGVSQRVLGGSLRGFCGALRGSAGVHKFFGGFSRVVTLCL